MDSLNIVYRSKTLAFLVLLFDCVPNMKNYCSIDRLLKNVYFLQVGTGKNPTTPLYSDTKKVKSF